MKTNSVLLLSATIFLLASGVAATVTCPSDQSSVDSWDLCPCADLAVAGFETGTMAGNPATRPNTIDVTNATTFSFPFMLMTPSDAADPACQSIDFTSVASSVSVDMTLSSENVDDVTLEGAVSLVDDRLVASWATGENNMHLTVGATYTLTATLGGVTSSAITFDALGSVPLVTTDTLSYTLNWNESATIGVTVKDAYEDGSGVVGKWTCLKGGEEVCPLAWNAATGAETSVSLVSNEQGTYTLSFSTKGSSPVSINVTFRVRCLDDSNELTWDLCPCAGDAVTTFGEVALSYTPATRPDTVDVGVRQWIAFFFKIKTPSNTSDPACANKDFTQIALSATLGITLSSPATGSVSAVSTRVSDSGAWLIGLWNMTGLVAGNRYTITASRGAASSTPYSFDAMTSTPIVTAGATTSYTVTSATTATVAMSVTDAYQDAVTMGTWSCAAEGGGACPSELLSALGSGTKTGLTLPKIQKKGTYTLLYTYKGVTSETMEVIVTCASLECPEGSCRATALACPCVEQAEVVFSTATVAPSTERALTVDVTLALDVSMAVQVKTPSTATPESCRLLDFTGMITPTASWTVDLVSIVPAPRLTLPSTVTTSTVSSLHLDANLLEPGHMYTITQTASTPHRTGSGTVDVMAMAATPVFHVPMTTVLALPLDISVRASVSDPYEEYPLGSWGCAMEGEATCPAALLTGLADGAEDGVELAGPIPAGMYTLFLTYKERQSENITLIVLCNEEELVDGRCPGACVYTCPDGTCALSAASCACRLDASVELVQIASSPVVNSDGEVNAGSALTLSVSALYRATEGACAGFNFNPYMRVAWRVLNGTTLDVPSSSVVANQSSVTFPAKYFVPGTSYAVVALLSDAGNVYRIGTALRFVASGAHSVSVTTGGSRLVVGKRGIRLPAIVVDAFRTSEDHVMWDAKCDGTYSCPHSLSYALEDNGTDTGAYVSGPVDARTYSVSLFYRDLQSATVTLVVQDVDAAIQVSVKTLTAPAVLPNVYLGSQTLQFAGSVTHDGATVFEWKVNGDSYGSNATLSVRASDLLANADNMIVLRATSVADSAVYAESEVVVRTVASPTVTIDSVNNMYNDSQPLVALTDVAGLWFSSSDVPAGAPVSYTVGYQAGASRIVVARVTAVVDPFAVFVAPMPANASDASLTFFVDLVVGGVTAATATETYEVVRGDPAAAAKAMRDAISHTEDPDLKMAAFVSWANGVEVATAEDLGSMFAELGKASESTMDAGAVLSAIHRLLGANAETKSSVAGETTAFMQKVASKVTPESAQAFLNVGAQVPMSTDMLHAMAAASLSVARSTPVGESSCFSAEGGSPAISATKRAGSAAGSATSSCGGASLSSSGLQGRASGREVTVYSAQMANPYGTTAGDDPATDVVTFQVDVDGSPYAVEDLATPALFTIPWAAGTPKCKYYNETRAEWSTDGVSVVSTDGTSVTCATTHFTSFAGFQSSGAAAVAASLVALVATVLGQLLLAQ